MGRQLRFRAFRGLGLREGRPRTLEAQWFGGNADPYIIDMNKTCRSRNRRLPIVILVMGERSRNAALHLHQNQNPGAWKSGCAKP